MTKRASGLQFRKTRKVGASRVTVTHKGIGVSTRIPGTGLSLSSRRGLTWFGRKPWKTSRRKSAGCAGALLVLILIAVGIACGSATQTVVPRPSSPATQEPTLVPSKTLATAQSQPTSAPTEPATPTIAPTAVRAAPTIRLATPTLAQVSWPCPTDATGALYIGNSSSRKFHTVRHAINSKVAPDHRICFATRQAAVDAGYEPCGTCKP